MKRAPGTGSVTPIPSGFWARLPINGKRESLGVYPSEAEADEVIEATRAKLAQRGVTTSAMTLRAWLAKYLDARELDGVRDIRTERNRCKTHIFTAPFVDDALASISTPAIADWVQQVQAKKTATPRHTKRTISRKTVKEVVRLLRSAFAAAIVQGLVESNPVAPVKVRQLPRTDEPWTYLLPDEQTALLTCSEIPEPDRVIIAFALGTMLREGEQFNLELRDLRVEGDKPHLVVRKGSAKGARKNSKILYVPLFGIGLQAAKRWLEILPQYAPKNPLGLVFPTRGGSRRPKGKHLHGAEWDSEAGKQRKVDFFQRYLVAAGIVAERRHDRMQPRWHDLRHTGASSLLAGWWGQPLGRPWRLEDVKEILGHSSITITQRYAHLAPGALQALASATPGLPPAPPALPLPNGPRGLPVGYENGAPRDTVPKSSRISLVGRKGLEPLTYGLKEPSGPEQSQALGADHNPAITRAAIGTLKALAKGDPEWSEHAQQLAEFVLSAPAARLALAVLAGGEHAEARATELAELVLLTAERQDAKGVAT